MVCVQSKSNMARIYTVPQFRNIFIILSFFASCHSKLVGANHNLDEDNWRKILEGEWLVEFYAPWCPACNALTPAWTELSKFAAQKSVFKTAGVDVTKSPGLSGRFVVTALPTIFHVKDGEFRQYKGPRDARSMEHFVNAQKWKSVDPIPGWKAPNSLQMTLVAEFFKLSQALRSVHTMLMDTYGLPTWGSYLIFAVATIFIGALLGLLLVCIIDLLYPPRRSDKVILTRAEMEKMGKGDQAKDRSDDDQEELINDDIIDDNVNAPNSDAERNSPSDSSEEEEQKPTEGAGDAKPEVRKRRPRKAD